MRIAVYAGTFDPITSGHVSVVERTARLFDRVFVLVATNPAKQPLFDTRERLDMIRDALRDFDNVTCTSTEGYVVDFAKGVGASFLIRGVRSNTDVESEIALSNMNYNLAPQISTVFIPAQPDLSEVSSSRLKELVLAGADVSRYCTPHVIECLLNKLKECQHSAGERRADVQV